MVTSEGKKPPFLRKTIVIIIIIAVIIIAFITFIVLSKTILRLRFLQLGYFLVFSFFLIFSYSIKMKSILHIIYRLVFW